MPFHSIYFSHNVGESGAFVLKKGQSTSTKINGIDKTVNSIAVDSNDNVYFGVADGIYLLKNGETTANKFNAIITSTINSLTVDSSNNIYFGTNNSAYVLKQGSTTSTKIDGIDKTVNSIAVDSNDNRLLAIPFFIKILL
ncbi:hypothetical protein [Spiroplasma poulsonii]|uniref:hypothetical protein n=1 Tax=Spiroplasma poulsonii TaxID=2138 RepID=UPI00058A1C61|nr:hypothetical protein [Spiroplasma poulsonii]